MGSDRRPTVVHAIRDWGLPSERFVVDLVRSVTRTRPVVVCDVRHTRPSTSPQSVPVTALRPVASRFPRGQQHRAIRALVAATALRRRAQLLHAHFGYWAAHTAAVAEKLRLPWVLSLHGHDLLVDWERELEQARVRTADLVIVPSQFLADAAVNRGFHTERIRVIPSGLDLDRYTFHTRALRPDGAVRVAFIGRFVAKKGVLDAARAMAKAVAQGARLHCLFVGYGPLLEDLHEELRRLGLHAEVYDGAAPDAVLSALDETDLVLTPSRTADDKDAETLGLVNLEAQLSGVPVITTMHGGIPEAVSPDGARVVPEGDVDALAVAILDLAHRPQLWRSMGTAGREHVQQHFRLADRVRDVEECYLQLIGLGRAVDV